MSVPIVFVHRGNIDYLWVATRQAKQTNPNSDLILLGDEANANLSWPDHHALIDDHWDLAEKFAEHYVHLSSNRFHFEVLCFQRWFALLDFMRANGLDACCCCDSDIMIYSDLTEQMERYSGDEISICGVSGHSLLIHTIDGLENLCEHMMRMYTDQTYLAQLKERFKSIHDGGISDMTAFEDYRKQNLDRVSNTGETKDGSRFDSSMWNSEGVYAMKNRFKEITWKEGQPHCRHTPTDELVRFHTLHFQGAAKRQMLHYASDFDFACAARILRQATVGRAEKRWASIRKRIVRKAA